MYIVLALLAGALVIICISINGQLANKVGLIQAGMTNFFVGLLGSIVYVYIVSGFSLSQVLVFKGYVPFYYFLGGVIGSLIMVLNSIVINKLSAVYVTILVFIGQLMTGMIIDYLRWQILSVGKIIGGVLIIIGLYYYIKGDKRCPDQQEVLV
ncbi:DMT family transporter [Wukongibacter baidiensis]|uniref:DMT family transporter n=1 Tax=Wukongibacter baidiensis TaxID=1723361 RepID=UPI003D7FBA47